MFIEKAYVKANAYYTDDSIPVSLGIDTIKSKDSDLAYAILQIGDIAVVSGNEITQSKWQYSINNGAKHLIDNDVFDAETKRFNFAINKSEFSEGSNIITIYYDNEFRNFNNQAIGGATFNYSLEEGVWVDQYSE